MNKSIYVAATFDRRDEAIDIAKALLELGYHVTSQWLGQWRDNLNKPTKALQEEAEQAGERDMKDVLAADIFLMITGDDKQVKPSGGGRHTEFGIAFHAEKIIFILGPRENVFQQSAKVLQVKDLGELNAQVNAIKQYRRSYA